MMLISKCNKVVLLFTILISVQLASASDYTRDRKVYSTQNGRETYQRQKMTSPDMTPTPDIVLPASTKQVGDVIVQTSSITLTKDVQQTTLAYQTLLQDIRDNSPEIMIQKIDNVSKENPFVNMLSAENFENSTSISTRWGNIPIGNGTDEKVFAVVSDYSQKQMQKTQVGVFISTRVATTPMQLIELYHAGADIGGIVNERSWIALVDVSHIAKISSLPFVQYVQLYQSSWKYTINLKEYSPKDTITVIIEPIKFQPHTQIGDLSSFSSNSIEYDQRMFTYTININAQDVVKIAELSWVAWIELLPKVAPVVLPPVKSNPTNTFTNPNYQIDDSRELINAPFVWQRGNTGANTTVGVIDSGIYDSHADFPAGTVLNTVAEPNGSNAGHGTHVSGIIAGRGNINIDGTYDAKGVAPASKLWVEDGFGLLGKIGWGFSLQSMYEKNIRIVNLSIGCKNELNPSECYKYDSISHLIDRYVYDGMSIVVSAGNERAYPDRSKTTNIISPANAKNAITVGAIGYTGNEPTTPYGVASYSSLGPTQNGLLKPDVVAPGGDQLLKNGVMNDWCVGSTNVYNSGWIGEPLWQWPNFAQYIRMCGTSMAAPHVSGILALMRAAFNTSVLNPRDYKALIVANAIPLKDKTVTASSGYANTKNGYGLVDALYSIYDVPNEKKTILFHQGTLVSGNLNSTTQKISVPSNADRLIVTMAYDDYSSMLLNSTSLWNQLTVSVKAPNNTVFQYTLPSGVKMAGTVQKIVIENPINYGGASNWEVTVTARKWKTPFSSQEYSVVAIAQLVDPSLHVTVEDVVVNQGAPFTINAKAFNNTGLTVAGIRSWASIPAQSGFKGNITEATGVSIGNLTGINSEYYYQLNMEAPNKCGEYKLTLNASSLNHIVYNDAKVNFTVYVNCANGNDNIDSPVIIPGYYFNYTHSMNTAAATTDSRDPNLPCVSTNKQRYRSVWYRYTPQQPGTIGVNLNGSNFDTILAIWKITSGKLVNVACNDDYNGSNTSYASISVDPGTLYYIEVLGFSLYSYGDLSFELNFNSNGNKSYFTTNDNQNNALLGVPDYDLDVYLGRTSNKVPIEADIYIPDVKMIRSAKLALLVYDVDEFCGYYAPCEVDQVFVNGKYIGDFTGANDQWSTTLLEVNPSILKTGNNLFSVKIDVLGATWMTTVDWAQFNVELVGSDTTIRSVYANRSLYLPTDTVYATIEVDTTLNSKSVSTEVNLLNSLDYNIDGTTVNHTITKNSDDAISVGLSIPAGTAAGKYKLQILTYDVNKVLLATSIVPINISTQRCYALDLQTGSVGGGTIQTTVKPNCAQTLYRAGTTLSLTPIAYGGHAFSSWSGSISGDASPSYIVMDEDKTIQANFIKQCYDLTLSVNPGGTGTASKTAGSCAGGKYAFGQIITLSATVDQVGYEFDTWSGGYNGRNNPAAIPVNGNMNITANYKLKCYTLSRSLNPVNGGKIKSITPPNCPNGQYQHGTTVTITAEPAANYAFGIWNGISNATDKTTSFVMTAHSSITANFIQTPVLTTPINNTLVRTYTPLLDWNDAVANIDTYNIQLSTDSSFNSLIIDTQTSLSSYQLGALTANRTYYWRIQAINTTGNTGKWSNTGVFRTVMLPPDLDSPDDGIAPLTLEWPLMNWTSVDGSSSYNVQVSVSPTFSQLAASVASVNNSLTIAIPIKPDTRYYWRVSGSGVNGPSEWSTVYSIQMPNPPSIPILETPTENVVVTDYTPTLEWKDATLPTGSVPFDVYRIQIASDVTFATLITDAETDAGAITSSSYTVPTDLNADTTYYWRVRSRNSDGHLSHWSSVRRFRTAVLPAQLLTPSNGVSLMELKWPLISWQAVNNATAYTVQIASDSGFTKLLVNTRQLGVTYQATFQITPGTTYYWRVRTEAANGPSEWSTVYSIQMPNPPSIPILETPTENVVVTDYTPTLEWKDATLPTGSVPFDVYRIQIASDVTFATLITDAETDAGAITSSSYTVPTDLNVDTTYYWRVRSRNSNGHLSHWSSVRRFRTAVPPVQLLTPSNGVSLMELKWPLISWQAVNNATAYTVQIASDSGFTRVLVNTRQTGMTYQAAFQITPGITYYWRVRTEATNGPSDWSEVWTMVVPNPPSVPVLVSPINNGQVNSLQPMLTWLSSILPVGTIFKNYNIQIATDSQFNDIVYDQLSVNTFVQVSPDLNNSQKYYWRVRTFNSLDQFSSWSLVRTFNTPQ
jgi:subtilisin family serine protease